MTSETDGRRAAPRRHGASPVALTMIGLTAGPAWAGGGAGGAGFGIKGNVSGGAGGPTSAATSPDGLPGTSDDGAVLVTEHGANTYAGGTTIAAGGGERCVIVSHSVVLAAGALLGRTTFHTWTSWFRSTPYRLPTVGRLRLPAHATCMTSG